MLFVDAGSAGSHIMLILSRKVGEKVLIADNIVVTVVHIIRGQVRLGIEVPPGIAIHKVDLATSPRKAQCLEGADDDCFAAARTDHAKGADGSALAEARAPSSGAVALDNGPEIGQSEETTYETDENPQTLTEESPTDPESSTADLASKVEASLAAAPEPAKQAALLDVLLKSSYVDSPFDALAGHLQGLNRAFQKRLIDRLEPALNAHLDTIMPTDNPRLTDPIERRRDLVKQKERVIAALRVLGPLGLAVRCADKDQPEVAWPGYLMLTCGTKIPRGEFRLTRRGGVTVEAAANLAKLLPLHLVEATAGQEAPHVEPARAGCRPKGYER
jgi:carbon storage regulator